VHAAGARIVIPTGALATPTVITLCGLSAPSAGVLSGVPLGQGYQAGPEGQTFLKPVQITLPFDVGRLPAGAGASHVGVNMAPAGTSDFAVVSASSSPTTGTVTVGTAHFTQFVPAFVPDPIFIATAPDLPDGTVGVPYAQPLAATGGTPPYRWSLGSGTLLPGIALAPAGALGGTPAVAGISTFFLVVSDAAGHSVQQASSMIADLAVSPVPTLSTVTPSHVVQGAPDTTVALSGAGFSPRAQVLFDGAPIPAAFIDGGSMAATVPSTALMDAGAHAIAVSNPPPGGGVSAAVTFTVEPSQPNPVPTIDSVTPSRLPVTSVDTQVAITGSNFIAATSAAIGTQGIPTQVVSATALNATLPASYLAHPGTLSIDVFNPAPGGGFSPSSVTLTVGGPDAGIPDAGDADSGGADAGMADSGGAGPADSDGAANDAGDPDGAADADGAPTTGGLGQPCTLVGSSVTCDVGTCQGGTCVIQVVSGGYCDDVGYVCNVIPMGPFITKCRIATHTCDAYCTCSGLCSQCSAEIATLGQACAAGTTNPTTGNYNPDCVLTLSCVNGTCQ
jgi:hypothetical protein